MTLHMRYVEKYVPRDFSLLTALQNIFRPDELKFMDLESVVITVGVEYCMIG
jgi:hypothetical protein